MTLTISDACQWLVANSWPRLDGERQINADGSEVIVFTRCSERHWSLTRHQSCPDTQFLSITPAHEPVDGFPSASYIDGYISFVADNAGVVEKIDFSETYNGTTFATCSITGDLTTSEIPLLLRGLRSAFTELINCAHHNQPFDLDRLEESLVMKAQPLLSLFDVPENEEEA